MVAAGLAGPARAAAGSVRDHVLGMTVLSGTAELLSFGGQVAKNVAGYDVSRLMVGALGVLGIICEVSMKVLPLPVATTSLCFECSEQQALAYFAEWAPRPLPINASSWFDGKLFVRLCGAKAAVEEACEALGGERMAADIAELWWRELRDQRHAFFSGAGAGEALWRVSLPARHGPLGLPGLQFLEWQGALRWWRSPASAEEVRTAATRAGGHASLLRRTDASTAVFSPLSNVLMGIHRRLKAAFDPDGILNPGRLYASL
jgi:glycolate oxidase FAD binding subunit